MSPVCPCKPIEAADTIESEKIVSISKSRVKLNSEQLPAARSRSNSIVNLAPESNQQTIIIKQRKIKSTKRQVAILRPTILINQSDNMAKVERMFDENGNNTVFGSGRQSFATPTKLKLPEPSFFGQRSQQLSPQLSSLNSTAFSPSNANKPKSKSVAEIIEGWPFKYPPNAINGKRNRKIPNETAEFPEANNSTKNHNNEMNKENVPVDIVSNERYPKSLYISPFTVAGRRPIRQKPQK